MRWRILTALLVMVAGCGIWLRLGAEAPKLDARPIFLYTAAPQYAGLAWLKGGERFPSGSSLVLFDGTKSRPWVAGFAATADAAVSFDGTHVLFAGKRTAGDQWQIFEAAADGGKPSQVTSCAEGCVRPLYLPEDRLVYARLSHGRFVVESAGPDGSAPLELSYTPGNALPTDVLRDGRVLFEAQYPLGAGASSELYTVYSDGSGVEAYRCDHGASRYAGRQVASGDIVLASQGKAARFTSALAREVAMQPAGGEFAGDVAEVSESEWLAAWRQDANSKFALQRMSPSGAVLGAMASDPAADVVQPVVVRPHAVPNRHPSGLHDWPNANLLALNVYTSKFKIAEGSVATVRLYGASNDGKAMLLGSATVERDGSFFVQVPGDRPLQFELVDSAGKTVQREQGWYWARRGEQRICVGCHAGPERAPENAVPAVLLKSTEPVALLGTAEASHTSHKGGR